MRANGVEAAIASYSRIGVYRGGAKRPWPPHNQKGEGAKVSDGPPHGMT